MSRLHTSTTGRPARAPRARRAALLAAALAASIGAGGCVDFTGRELSENPNQPSTATSNQLLIAVTSFAPAGMTGDPNRAITIWMQQMAGTGRQWLTIDAPYIIDENTFGSFATYYTGGGLVDLRAIQRQARDAGDRLYLGIAQVWEAMLVGYMADVWGDIPYREAINPAIRTPKLDPQQQVYADLQRLLDEAIGNLAAGGTGPGAFDLIYGGNRDRWVRAARTLKARYFLHVAERDPAAYAQALAQANQGIDAPAGDFRTYQSGNAGEENQWFQFRRGRGTDIGASAFMVGLLENRTIGGRDPRLAQYLAPSTGGRFVGAGPGEENENASWLSAQRGDAGFRQPMVTWAENQLIKAEAQLQGGNLAAATTELNAVRTAVGLPAVPGNLARAALYQQIMEEKYVALFQNVEVWSDWKRTCWPNIAPGGGARTVPARFFYGADERSSNSANIPSPSQQPRRNWNDPVNATALDGSACLGQR